MSSQNLEYFCRVADFGSFSRAAVVLGINQSALSRHVRSLEAELGVQLFYRNGRGVVLTEQGQRLFERASRALEEIALARQEAVNSRPDAIRSVVIGVTPTVGRVLVQPMAVQLIAAFPEIKLQFIEGFTGHLMEWLDSGRVDVAVLYKSWATERLKAEHLIDENLCLIAPAGAPALKPKTPSAVLADVPLILPSAKHGLRRLIETVATEHKLKLSVRIEADSLESILMLVKADLGYSVLPAAPIREEVARGQVQASLLIRPEVTRTLLLAIPANRPAIHGLPRIARTIKAELQRFGSDRRTAPDAPEGAGPASHHAVSARPRRG